MKQLLWIDGRLPWPLVVTVAFITVSLLCVDFIWRVVVLPIETLMLIAALVVSAAAIGLIAAYILWWGRRIQ
jgi:hypothetical protein